MDFYSTLQGADGGGAQRPTMSLADMIADDGVNKSFSSAITAASSGSGGASSSSKAVLAALRALQDKIRRLETERSQALDEASQLRMQLKNQEIEHDHAKQREQLAAQKSLQEARSTMERITGEKQELELRLAKLEEKNRSLQSNSEELQLRIRHLEEEKQNTAIRFRDLENHHAALDQQLRMAQNREKDAAEVILWETRKHEEELGALQTRIRQLQVELSEVSQVKGTLDSKAIELDQLVAQLLSLNECLVAQLSGRPVKLTSTTKKVKKKKKVSADKPPRAAEVSTVASDAGRTTKFSSRSGAHLIPIKSDDVEQLKAMHKMYANMAKSLRKNSPAKSRRSKSPSRVATRMSSKKSSTTGSSGNGLADSRHDSDTDRYTESLATSRSFSATGGSKREVFLPKPALSFDPTDSEAHDEHGVSYLSHSSAALRRSLSDSHLPGASSSSYGVAADSPSPSRVQPLQMAYSHHHLSSSGGGAGKDMQQAISTLEEEFDDLNRQYRRLLSNVQAANTVPSENDLSSAERIQAQAEEIVHVIQKLHQKGEQLRLLRSPPR